MVQLTAERLIGLRQLKEEDVICALEIRRVHHHGVESCGRYILMNTGDLIWQSRMPGGVCIYLGERAVKEGDRWETYYKVLHHTEGLIEDPAYYYMTLEEEEIYSKRRAVYELEKAGHPVPSWLRREIEVDDESR